MTKLQQCSHLPQVLPACVLAVAVGVGMAGEPLAAQDRYRVVTAENFRREPGPDGRLLARVNEGANLDGLATRAGWVQVALSGWIWRESIREIDDANFDYAVNAPNGENLRATPNGTVIARLSSGFWMKALERRGAWMQVERTGWIWSGALERIDRPVAALPAVESGSPPQGESGDVLNEANADDGSVALDRAVTIQAAPLRQVPAGDTTGTLASNAPVRIIARSGEWVRVQTEGWVHENDLRPAAEGVLVAVSGAEVRARPQQYEGTTLQWTLQLLAIQTADGVRRELVEGQRYMLARGPLPEAGFVYVTLTDDQVAVLERLPPLVELVTIVKVLVGRDQYLGNPVVELLEMSVRDQ